MTPKEKAEELRSRFSKHVQYWDCYNDIPLEENHAKQCALICVDEIRNSVTWSSDFNNEKRNYWQEVKNEIEKL